MAAIGILAQHIQDLYYQQYKSSEDFFEDHHFEFLASSAYAKLLQAEYEKNWKMNFQTEGYGFVDINQDWLKVEEPKLEKDTDGRYFIKLEKRPFSFMYDRQNSGIQTIIPIGGKKCAEFIRMHIDERWKICTLPQSNQVFWYPEGDKIFFENIDCKPEKIKVLYVPGLDGNCEIDCNFNIPTSKEADVISWVLNTMFAAKNGNVVDMTANSNPNKTIQTEADTVFSQIKTKS